IAPFNFTLTLDMTQNGPEMWSATGSLLVSDQTTATNAIEAHFRSTNILIKNGSGYTLNIDGILSPLSGESILVNRGDPWRFAGDGNVYHVTFPADFYFRPTPASPDADGTPGQITVAQSRSYGNGDLFVIKVNVPVGTLDDLFASDRSMTGGEVKGSIVPAPAAVLLGLVGLAAVGWYRRRLA
ncbi:MAG: hypothetical protein NTX87_06865, partial [Planctomycetota bacterium]|nr:hypothetical protein [Planctomycetota bacterium]